MFPENQVKLVNETNFWTLYEYSIRRTGIFTLQAFPSLVRDIVKEKKGMALERFDRTGLKNKILVNLDYLDRELLYRM